MIPHNRPTLGKEEQDAAARVLLSGWVAGGKEVEAFENEFCDFVGMSRGSAVALSSGTAALYLGLISQGVTYDDEIIIPTYACSAILNAVIMTGATPVLADIEKDGLNISVDDVAAKKTARTKAVVVVHAYGNPLNIENFNGLAVPIIEDCAQALGAKIAGVHVGKTGHAAIYSFYASKMITTGYGGMLVSVDSAIIARARDYRAFDCRDTFAPRFNFHLSDINAAVGREQLKKLPKFLARRKEIVDQYRGVLPLENLWPNTAPDKIPNFYRVLFESKRPEALKAYLEHKGISTIVPLERFELLHRYLGQSATEFPTAEQTVDRFVSLPAYPSLTDDEIRTIARAVLEGEKSV